MLSLFAPQSSSALTWRACWVLSALFWTYVSASAVARWELLRQALPQTPVPAWPLMALTCLLLLPVLLLLVRVSYRVGYEPSRWPRVVLANVLLALAFGLCARPAMALSRSFLSGIPFADALARMDSDDFSVASKLWASSVIEDSVQYLVLQVILAGAAFYARMRHEQEQRRELNALYDRARLQSLRMQTNPHFLFNTLSAIAGLVRSRPEAAETMITQLGELFRSTLSDRDADFVSLRRELDLGEKYLAIQTERFDTRLRYVIDADTAAQAAAIPPLLLQPLLENAVEHGLTTQEGSMLIEVRCAQADGRVTVSVRNRLGRAIVNPPRGGSGFGLDNVRTRLQAAFGAAAEFAVGPTAADHFEARMTFPVRAVNARSRFA